MKTMARASHDHNFINTLEFCGILSSGKFRTKVDSAKFSG